MKKIKLLSLLSVITVILILLCSCSGGIKNAGSALEDSYNKGAYDQGYSEDIEESLGSITGSPLLPPEKNEGSENYSQKIIKTGRISAETTDFDAALSALEAKIAELGGYIGSSEIYGNSISSYKGARRAVLSVRIPADRFDAFITHSSELFNVTSRYTSSEDVTGSYYQAESKLKSLKIQEERVLAMLSEATKLSDMISLEDKLASIRSDITYYDSIVKAYDNKISYSTVTVSLSEVKVYTEVEDDEPSFAERIANAFSTSWKSFARSIENLAVTFVYNLPAIIVILVILSVIIISVKRKKNRKNKAKKDNGTEKNRQDQ